MAHMYPLVSKAILCGLFGFSRQAWYDNKKRQSGLQMQEVFILTLAKQLRKEHKRMGAEKLHRLITPKLQEHNIKYGRDKFYFLLREHGLLVKRRKRGPKTTNSNHLYRKYPNLIREVELLSSGRLWVSDITYIRTEKGFVYLSLVTDAYSKKIVGWCLWPDLTSEGALNALRMAVAGEGVKPGLIHHSDRGIQYCCNDYVNFLKGSKINISMTENGDPYENAIAERVNGILKDEYDLNETFADYHAALEATKLAVHKYNNKRPHRSVDFMFPKDAHQQQGPLKKHWKKRKYRVSGETVNRPDTVPVKRE
ncbi:IS3 family transposase [Draconibacterium sp.]|uniref:IS3 family transposase n=1 Tax=Draconibacterium sp. TaxID=1965318 RepID=UPI003565DF0B